jgi:hypothetical protein
MTTATQLRADLYNLLDRVLETGEPLEILRKGRVLRIAPAATSWVERLPRREAVIVGNPDEIVHIDWSEHWSPESNLSPESNPSPGVPTPSAAPGRAR